MEKILAEVSCDRCKKVYQTKVVSQKDVANKANSEADEPILSVRFGRPPVQVENVRFTDLCNRCKKRVHDLVVLLRMEPQKKGGKKDKSKPKGGDDSKQA